MSQQVTAQETAALHKCAFASGPMQAGQGRHVRMTQHDVTIVCSSPLKHTTLATAGWAQQRIWAGVRSRHRRSACSRNLTVAEAALWAALPYSFNGAWDAARHAAALQVQLGWGCKPCIVDHVQFDGIRPMSAA